MKCAGVDDHRALAGQHLVERDRARSRGIEPVASTASYGTSRHAPPAISGRERDAAPRLAEVDVVARRRRAPRSAPRRSRAASPTRPRSTGPVRADRLLVAVDLHQRRRRDQRPVTGRPLVQRCAEGDDHVAPRRAASLADGRGEPARDADLRTGRRAKSPLATAEVAQDQRRSSSPRRRSAGPAPAQRRAAAAR